MAPDNGSKIPFGPHGEGCECELEPSTEMPHPASRISQETTEKERIQALMSIIFTMASDHLSEHLTNAFTVLGYIGQPLTQEQMKHLIGAQMRGFTASHAGAYRAIDTFFEAREEHEAQKDHVPKPKIGSLKELLEDLDGS